MVGERLIAYIFAMKTTTQSSTKTSVYYSLPELPFAMSDLEPVISKETLEFHYKKHHQGYVDKLNKLIHGTPLERLPLDEVIKKATGSLYNNAAQVWNHNFYWNCLSPNSVEPTTGEFLSSVDHAFGSMTEFQGRFTKAGEDLFGSGYVWLVKDSHDALSIIDGKDAFNPLTEGNRPLLTCDVWEHAYYLDYRNVRKDYLKNFWKIVNWDFVEAQFSTH